MHEKKQFIDALKPGDRVDDVFILSAKSVSQKKNGDSYLKITLADKAGTVEAKVWDNVDQINGAAKSGEFVHVIGSVSEYRGTPQVTITSLTLCDRAAMDPADFLPKTARNVDAMFERLRKTVDECVGDEHIRALLNAFFDDEVFADRFKLAPGAKKMHHAWIGGLLEHTLSMTVLAKEIAKHYAGVNLDLLLAGVVLHDIGKTREFAYDYVIDYTDEGKLVSHIVIGCGMVDDKVREIEDFPPETAMLIKHMIVSHHGIREFGSPEPPKIIEAVLLHHIDNIDAKMIGLREFIAKEDPDEPWTSFSPMMGTPVYKGHLVNDD